MRVVRVISRSVHTYDSPLVLVETVEAMHACVSTLLAGVVGDEAGRSLLSF